MSEAGGRETRRERSVREQYATVLVMLDDLKGQVDLLTRCVANVMESQRLVRDAQMGRPSWPVASGVHDGLIYSMAQRGFTDKKIAERIGCCPGTVRNRRRVLGIDLMHSKQKWTQAEDRMLRELCKTCVSFTEVSRHIQTHTPNSCRYRADKLGIPLLLSTYAPPWTLEEDDYLRARWPTGEDSDDIARAIGRTREACTSRAYKLGLTGSGERLAKRARWAS